MNHHLENKIIPDFSGREEKNTFRHTSSHILAQAVKRLYPGVKLAIGPAIENGFYYDFDFPAPVSTDDLKKIEQEMQQIIKENHRLEKFSLPKQQALEAMADEPYKTELILALPEEEEITFYRQGEFTDLCAGPHLASTGQVKAAKLLSVAGAYWRGDEKNRMLTRIYGTSFPSKAELKEHLLRLEDAKKRDHRKLGKELKLFSLMEEGKGFPFFLPNGMIFKNTLIDFWRDIHQEEGYMEISTPMMLDQKLWETSGHWSHYKQNMYTTQIDGSQYAIKPMNCPGGMLFYQSEPRSYHDLPMRVRELGLVHRHEKSGALHGLMRVRCFTQDDAHIFMTEDQVTEEIKCVIRLIDRFYQIFGFTYHVELSTRPQDSMGSDADWEHATSSLITALHEMDIPYIINEGDGAFYGPKIDFHLEDSLGRTWQCGTIQLDFQLPLRFGAEYTGPDGEKHRPIMIHRVVFGSVERFVGILIEHYAGKFPLWLAPVQVKILPISDKFSDYASLIEKQLKDRKIRCETDNRAEKIGFRIREAQLEKIPYMLIVGEKEEAEGTVSVRRRDEPQNVIMSLNQFNEILHKEITEKK